MERKRKRPDGLPSISLTGVRGIGTGVADLLDEVKEGVQYGRFKRGDILPSIADLMSLYRISETEAASAVVELQALSAIQYHDEYTDTYFIDTSFSDKSGRSEPSLATRVSQLEASHLDLLRRIKSLEDEVDGRV
ncbi:hypothetical protein [Streptomyces sp. NPDC051561]|uniref:hypothetical protein n=1 Tax=Streptomyces sp. NPDC051561 TaxID=3365658 RepID=UPI0037A0FBBE